jgi:hypothetical protein
VRGVNVGTVDIWVRHVWQAILGVLLFSVNRTSSHCLASLLSVFVNCLKPMIGQMHLTLQTV